MEAWPGARPPNSRTCWAVAPGGSVVVVVGATVVVGAVDVEEAVVVVVAAVVVGAAVVAGAVVGGAVVVVGSGRKVLPMESRTAGSGGATSCQAKPPRGS